MSKKLVQINVVCNGSTGRIMEQIQKTAEEHGYEAYSFYGRGKPSNDKCFKIGNMFDVLWNVFLTRVFDKHGYGSKRATKKLVEKIKKIDPDVIQLHNLHGYYLNLDILFEYLKTCNKKIFWTLHDCWAFTGHCSHFTYPKCEQWKTGCKKCIRKEDYPASLGFDNSEKNFKHKKDLFTGIKGLELITPSEWLKNLVEQSFLKEYTVTVINNGINLEQFKPTNTIGIYRKYNIPKDKKIILGVAAVWSKQKGLEDFIKLSKVIDNDFVIVLVGLNEKQIRGLPKNVIGIKRTESIEELSNIYTNAAVFINFTYEDNFPTTNLEALACGTPVITYNTGGSPESINYECGIVLEKLIPDEVLKNINRIENMKKQDCIKQATLFNGAQKYEQYIEKYER
mgnify:CR=1 FL=1